MVVAAHEFQSAQILLFLELLHHLGFDVRGEHEAVHRVAELVVRPRFEQDRKRCGGEEKEHDDDDRAGVA